jgi:parvulin-like peptidyl-prolyl isomerase
MKMWRIGIGALSIMAILGAAGAGNALSATTASQSAAVSQETGTKAVSEGPAISVKIPLFAAHADSIPLAVVNDEAVTLGDLTTALGLSHKEQSMAKPESSGKIDYKQILDRLINVRLVVQEATRIGLDELTEFKTALANYSENALAKQLMREVTADVKADPAKVEKRYKELTEEWKLKSLFFEKEEDAKNMAAALKSGGNFEELAKKAVDEKKAKGLDEGSFLKPGDLAPQIVETVSTLGTGSVSPLVKVRSGKTMGFTIIKLEAKRYPEDPKLREQAEASVLDAARLRGWEAYKTSLVKKYVKVREKTVKGLDYEANIKKFPALLKDKRVVADIQGEPPITVGDLTDALAKKFWHGPEEAAKSKRLNMAKRSSLFLLIGKRVIAKDVSDRKLASSEEYLKGLRGFNDSTLFGLFVERVVIPDVKVSEEDVKSYFKEHQKDYEYPEMMKVSSIVFGSKKNAEAAIKSLQKGSDLNWVRSNAEGALAGSEDDPLSSLNGSILTVSSMPPGMSKVVTGAHAGEYRLFEGGEKRFYVLSIDDAIPARPQPYEEVRELVSRKVFDQKLSDSIEDWFRKLRSASSIRIYLSETGK